MCRHTRTVRLADSCEIRVLLLFGFGGSRGVLLCTVAIFRACIATLIGLAMFFPRLMIGIRAGILDILRAAIFTLVFFPKCYSRVLQLTEAFHK